MTLRARRYLASLPLTLFVGVAACGGSEPAPAPPPPPPPSAMPAPMPAPAPAPTAETPAAPAASALPDVAIGPGTSSDQPKKLPKVTIKSPTKDQAIAADKVKDFEVKLDVKDWETQVGGPHVHLILDNHPYKPIYNPKTSVKLSDLVGPNDSIGEGEHLLVAFPSRMNHESVKGAGAIAMQHFWVGKKDKSAMKPTDPMLVYSRPKGTYNASKADKVLLDWYLVNAELGDGKFSIKANVKGPGIEDAGRSLVIKEWKPYVMENLRNGDYTISLELDDKDGKAVPGAWNSTTRTITINRDAPEDPAPAPPPPPPAKEEKGKPEKGAKPEKADKPKDEKKEEKPAEKAPEKK